MIIGVRIPSAATTTNLTPQPSARHTATGDSFGLVLDGASVNRFPVQSAAGTAPKEQVEQGSSNKSVTKQAAAQTVPVQSNGGPSTRTLQSPDDRNKSVGSEASHNQEKSKSKADHPANSPQYTSIAQATPDCTAPTLQIADKSAVDDGPSRGQGNGQSVTEENSAANAKAANEHVFRVVSDESSPMQPQAASNRTTVETNELSKDQPVSVNSLDTSDFDGSAVPTKSIEMQSAASGTFASADGTPLQQPMPFPMVATPPGKQGGIDGASNTTPKMGSARSTAANQIFVSATNLGSGKTGESANSPNDTSTHSSQGTQAQPTQNSGASPRIIDISASHPNAQTAANQTISNLTTTAPRLATTPGDASHTGAQRQVAPSTDQEYVPTMASSAISNARLMQTMNQSEMRIGLSSNAFGDISIRTSISGHELVAQISLDHGELSQAISAQVSSMQTRLGNEHGLHALIEINNHASSQSGDAGGSSQRERGSHTAPLPKSSTVALADEGSALSQETILNTAIENRLDIRA
jgi:hypothetical protein